MTCVRVTGVGVSIAGVSIVRVFRMRVISVAMRGVMPMSALRIVRVGAIGGVCGMGGGSRLRHMDEGIDMTKYRRIGSRVVGSGYR